MLDELKQAVLDLFVDMEEVGTTIHPYVDGRWRHICMLLDIDEEKLPTEGKQLRDQYGKPDRHA